jgi:hypothetical protein
LENWLKTVKWLLTTELKLSDGTCHHTAILSVDTIHKKHDTKVRRESTETVQNFFIVTADTVTPVRTDVEASFTIEDGAEIDKLKDSLYNLGQLKKRGKGSVEEDGE